MRNLLRGIAALLAGFITPGAPMLTVETPLPRTTR